MFSESAELYDIIYATFKDYERETDRLAARITAAHPHARSVLDVACGTGEHARLLAERHGLNVDGIDLDASFVKIAAAKHPAGRFQVADMRDVELGRQYDVVLCLFSSIAYVRTLDGVVSAIGRFRDHLAPGGVVFVEPWFPPGQMTDGYVTTNVGERNDVHVVRRSRTEIVGRLSRLHFDYEITEGGHTRHAAEVHELGLFTEEEMRSAFASNGLAVEYDAEGLIGRGLYLARR